MILKIILFNILFIGSLGQYIPEDVYHQAEKEYLKESGRLSERFKRQADSKSLKKDASSFHSSILKTSQESQKIDMTFKIALKASKMLKNSNLNITKGIKLKAPPKFCPFAFEPNCFGVDKYRKIDGSCNNKANSLIGKASTPFKRLLRTAYEDRLDEPRKTGKNGESLPNPRMIALRIHDPLDLPAKISNFGVIFGQFVDHDFTLAASAGSGSTPLKCLCSSSSEDCINIVTPQDDIFDDQQCMVLTRSAASFDKFDCSLNAREQLNLITHWLDLSQMYGSDSAQESKLRSFRNGKLRTKRINGFDSKEFLPNANPGNCVEEFGDEVCFEGGDTRTNENMMLVAIHTVWLREHNRIATELKKLNPTWSDEDLYQEARRITIAEYQNVIYNEWLPNIIGKDLVRLNQLEMQNKQFFMGYNPDVNPHMAAEFSTAAFRFGHTLLRSFLSKSDKNLKEMGNLTLSNIILRPVEAYTNGGLDSICRGLLVDSGTSFDPHFTDEVQNHLFETNAFDVPTRRFSLSAINIMRGRDHGLPPYNEFRKLVGLKEAKSFDDLVEVPPNLRDKLKRIYSDVNDIDAFTGGTSEMPLPDAILGPTFGTIVAQQFRDLKLGDRYYFENGNNSTINFSLPQLNQIRKSTMSRIVCDNLDIDMIQKNAFLPVSENNPLVICKTFKKVNLKKWKNEPLPTSTSNQDFFFN